MPHSSKTAFLISLVILLAAATYVIKLSNPTGFAVADSGCADTDGGQEPFEHGFLTSSDGMMLEDACADTETVQEAYCDNDEFSQLNINCPVGKMCVNGACGQ